MAAPADSAPPVPTDAPGRSGLSGPKDVRRPPGPLGPTPHRNQRESLLPPDAHVCPPMPRRSWAPRSVPRRVPRRTTGPARCACSMARRTVSPRAAPRSGSSPCRGSPCTAWMREAKAGRPRLHGARRTRRQSSPAVASTNDRPRIRRGTRPNTTPRDHTPNTDPRGPRTGRGRRRTADCGTPCARPRRPNDDASSWRDRSCTHMTHERHNPHTSRRRDPSSCPSTDPSSCASPRMCGPARNRTATSRGRSVSRSRYRARPPRRRSWTPCRSRTPC